MKNAARLAGAFVLLSMLALTGCGKKLDNTSVENGIKDKLAGREVTATSVSCPKDREVKQGDTFECTVTIEGGQTLTVTLEQADANGTLNFDPGNQVLDGAAIASQLERALSSGSTTVTATCPPTPIVPGGNGSIECTTVASDGATSTLVLTVKDGQVDPNYTTK